MTSPLHLFHHVYLDHKAPKTIFLLHGTGGNENDLFPFVAPLKNKYNFLGLRGNINESGMNRFFKRKGMGIFDQESIRHETQKLAEFIKAWQKEKNTQADELAFVGYSNGANMILALSFSCPHLVKKAVLLHPMLPFTPPKISLKNSKFLVTYGVNDPMISATDSQKITKSLKDLGASMEVLKHEGGHELAIMETQEVISFLSK